MADDNQSLSVQEAVRRIQRLDREQLVWVEESTPADDDVGHARIAATVGTPIQLGENWWGPHDMARSLNAGSSDLVMLDAMKIGGVTGWQRGAALAEARGLPVSSHVFVEVSAHLPAVTPARHWLEYLDLAGPILSQPTVVTDGYVERPLLRGLAWSGTRTRSPVTRSASFQHVSWTHRMSGPCAGRLRMNTRRGPVPANRPARHTCRVASGDGPHARP
jgi:L-alanine-DL-glutamate epimerase-like enolase superfamily enzyme